MRPTVAGGNLHSHWLSSQMRAPMAIQSTYDRTTVPLRRYGYQHAVFEQQSSGARVQTYATIRITPPWHTSTHQSPCLQIFALSFTTTTNKNKWTWEKRTDTSAFIHNRKYYTMQQQSVCSAIVEQDQANKYSDSQNPAYVYLNTTHTPLTPPPTLSPTHARAHTTQRPTDNKRTTKLKQDNHAIPNKVTSGKRSSMRTPHQHHRYHHQRGRPLAATPATQRRRTHRR
jgi:hypothetical protein